MCRRGPLTFADDGQSGAVNDEVQAGARAGAPKREGEMLTASRERGVIGCREIDAQHPDDRCQEALGLTQRYVEDETERQGGFDGEIGILELPAPPADASRCPRGDRVGREPAGDVASPHEGSVVLGPVPDAIRCRVLRMHSRLHIEIMTRRRSRFGSRVIVACALTEPTADDAITGISLVDEVDGHLTRVTADPAYDTLACYGAAGARGARVVVPPTKTASVSRRGARSGARDRTIRRVKALGRRRWKKASGYHQQARVENAFFRYTSIVGDCLRARSSSGQRREAVLACHVLNRMTELGRPVSYRIGR